MSNEVEQYKESISEKYIKDFKKELKFYEKAMILPIEKKMKEILKSDKKIDVSNLRDLEDLWFWRKVLWFKIWDKQLFENLMTKTFNFLKEKQEKIIQAESAWRLEELSSLVINDKLDELDALVTDNDDTSPQENNENNGSEQIESPEEVDSSEQVDSNNPTEQPNLSKTSEEGKDNRTTREVIQDNSKLAAGGMALGSTATFSRTVDALWEISGRGWRQALKWVELSSESAKNLMDNTAEYLKWMLTSKEVKLSKSMRKEITKSIEEFGKVSDAITPGTVDAIKIWEQFWEELPVSVINKVKIDPKVAKQLQSIPDDEITALLNESSDAKQLQRILKERKGIDVSEDAARLLKAAKNADDFKSISKIFKELEWVKKWLKWLKGACLISFIFLWFDIWAAIETGKEADMIKKVNKERAKYKKQWAWTQVWIWIAWVLLDIAVYAAFGSSVWPRWAVAWVLVWVTVWLVQMVSSYAFEDYYDSKEFYAYKRVDFAQKSRANIKQSIVQLIKSDEQNLRQELKEEIKEMRGPDSDADTIEDAWEALIFQEECEENWYYMIQQYYYSWKPEGEFLEGLSEEEKTSYKEEKEELEWKINIRMEYIKKFIKKEDNTKEYQSFIDKIKSNQWVAYVEQILADSKVYASLKWEMENPYIENYQDLDVEWYKQAYKAKLQSEYPHEFELFENMAKDSPMQLNEICSWVAVLENSLFDISSWEVDSELDFTSEERQNIAKNVEFVKRFDEYFNLGKPIESKLALVSMDNVIDFAYVEQVLADNFQSINKRPSWDKDRALDYMYWSSYRDRMDVKYDVSDSLTENILYCIARECHGYTWINDKMELINFYNEWDKGSVWIYYDSCRRFNWDWWNDRKITSDISTLDQMSADEIYKTLKRWKLDSSAEVADKELNNEYRAEIEKIIIREVSYREHKEEYEKKIIEYVKESSIDGGYVELPYDLMIAAKKSGIWKIENYLFRYQDWEIYAISCGDTVDDLMYFDKTNQKINYEATTELRDTLTEEENNLIKPVDAACKKLGEMRSVEMDFWKYIDNTDHTDELDIPAQLEKTMSKKMQDWEKEKEALKYMQPILAQDYLKNKAKEYFDYFDGLYRGLLTVITSYKCTNDINDVNDFNRALDWTSQFNIVSVDDKWNLKFTNRVPETIQKILPELFDYYKDPTLWKTVSELLHSEDSEEQSKWQFLARQIYTICMEDAVLDRNSRWKLVDFNVNRDDNLDVKEVKVSLNERMWSAGPDTFNDAVKDIKNMDINNIKLKDKGVRKVTKIEKDFHFAVEEATKKIIKTMPLTDWEWFRWDPTFIADKEQNKEWAVTWSLQTWNFSEPITLYADESWENIKSVRIDWLDMTFSDVEEWFRVANLINFIKGNKRANPKWTSAGWEKGYCNYGDYIRKHWKLDRDIEYWPDNVIILRANAVNDRYSSIKERQKFLDYINSSKV